MFAQYSIFILWNFVTGGGCRLIVRYFHKQWKCTWPFLKNPGELKPGSQGRKESRGNHCFFHLTLIWESAGCCKAPSILWPTNNTILPLSCCFGSSSTSPFTRQSCYLKVVTLTSASMYSSCINFPIQAAQGPQMRSQPLSTWCWTKL